MNERFQWVAHNGALTEELHGLMKSYHSHNLM